MLFGRFAFDGTAACHGWTDTVYPASIVLHVQTCTLLMPYVTGNRW